MKKQAILDLLETMPEEVDNEDLLYKLYVLEEIEKGEADRKAGRLISQEEAEREMERWRE